MRKIEQGSLWVLSTPPYKTKMPTVIGKPTRGKASFSNFCSLLGQTVTLHWKRPVIEQAHFTIVEHDGQIGFKPNGLDERIFLNMSRAMKAFSRPTCHSPSSKGSWFQIRTGAHAGKTLANI